MESLLAGFLLGLSLIVAIGAQNAFVLKQGLRKHYVFLVCSVCALSDALLIAAGVAGFGAIVEAYPAVVPVARWGGAAFLTAYGVRSLITAFRTRHSLEPEGDASGTLVQTLLICLAFTWLNPHVYLDTVVLLGSIAAQYEGDARLYFGAGAITASFTFFFSLGFGARLLTPIFHKPAAWQILDFVIGVVMLAIALSLVLP